MLYAEIYNKQYDKLVAENEVVTAEQIAKIHGDIMTALMALPTDQLYDEVSSLLQCVMPTLWATARGRWIAEQQAKTKGKLTLPKTKKTATGTLTTVVTGRWTALKMKDLVTVAGSDEFNGNKIYFCDLTVSQHRAVVAYRQKLVDASATVRDAYQSAIDVLISNGQPTLRALLISAAADGDDAAQDLLNEIAA